MTSKLRTALVALLTLLVIAPAGTVAEGKRAKKKAPRSAVVQECVDADLEATPGNLRRIRGAILCLHNQVRAEHRLPALREHRRLRKAAVRHARDMVRDGYFEHTTPTGTTMVDRILRARYVREDAGWALGENLAWGTGSLGTPRGAVQSWMESPGHRANILKRSYRELGVGVVLGVPVSDAAGATYTVDFGVRR